MKGWKRLLVALPFVLIGGHAAAQTISSSPHDLSSGDPLLEDKNELCVYCHTPHAARTDIDAPLWNKPATSATYTSYSSSTLDGDIATTGSVSIACLTCHDGTQATDAVINAPGTGLGDGNIGVTSAPLGAVTANLGADLTNDHPIGIRYGNYTGNPQIDPDFVIATSGTIGGTLKWWVDTDVAGGTREKSDMILYTRTADTTPRVECASCHDPHVGDPDDAGGTNAAGSDISFMRISNENSDVCLACHVK